MDDALWWRVQEDDDEEDWEDDEDEDDLDDLDDLDDDDDDDDEDVDGGGEEEGWRTADRGRSR